MGGSKEYNVEVIFLQFQIEVLGQWGRHIDYAVYELVHITLKTS